MESQSQADTSGTINFLSANADFRTNTGYFNPYSYAGNCDIHGEAFFGRRGARFGDKDHPRLRHGPAVVVRLDFDGSRIRPNAGQ
ncbi:MAG: hypothetical protein ABI837_07065, partial [Acidobacteriota bacterium]